MFTRGIQNNGIINDNDQKIITRVTGSNKSSIEFPDWFCDEKALEVKL